jgi:hypothetical protein
VLRIPAKLMEVLIRIKGSAIISFGMPILKLDRLARTTVKSMLRSG